MRRLLPAVLFAAACSAPAAQSPIQTPASMPARVEQSAGGLDVMLSRSEHPVSAQLDMPVERAWSAALDAYRALGLRLDAVDAARHQARGRTTVRRTLGGTRLSSYFECGDEPSGAIADSWRLTIDGQLAVAPGTTPNTSVLATMFTVRATPVEGTSASVSQCSSHGLLESRLAEKVRQSVQ